MRPENENYNFLSSTTRWYLGRQASKKRKLTEAAVGKQRIKPDYLKFVHTFGLMVRGLFQRPNLTEGPSAVHERRKNFVRNSGMK
jgi:hypothetical protein